ncbi:CRISPR system Cascade subunit CasC [Ruminococcus sp. YE71]|uniref:type I-E CRISPR-associated protein Cas7/Cse4/CasC n=1 Tax=unclassified Ruminococcus TaxID=2608920 RepID=UPI00087E0445|nr:MULTISPECIES: type I-E CRISPR-associated protein Cas7/Cse4/CasC [unclassified Ruminococcus]SDA32287.1 CRISPR system Cascade subunit CasC [Ruminococcus sp. YE78]SFW53140.1 CRISPR system Cascade subunit CasC [Ruminococcus sp. YE71]
MDKQRFYVDIHILQTVPPSCVNRDDTGRPKTAVYGGANRARVSSQAWKHAVRDYFKDLISFEKLGYRTKYVKKLIVDSCINMSSEFDQEDYEKAVDEVLKLKYKRNGKEHTLFDFEDKDKTKVLFFISHKQSQGFAAQMIEDLKKWATEKEKDKKVKLKDIVDVFEYRKILSENPSIDLALFGRMAADDVDLNVDAACQVAHSISTHVVNNEYDFFTAVDDCDKNGAGHLSTMEFNSSTLYRYATINVTDLKKWIGSDAADAVKGFTEAFICSMPTGKQNSYANRTLPDMVYVTVRKDQPVNLCGAFEKPVVSKEGYIALSKKALFEHAERVYDDFCGAPDTSFVVGNESVLGAEKVSINVLLDKLSELVSGVV